MVFLSRLENINWSMKLKLFSAASLSLWTCSTYEKKKIKKKVYIYLVFYWKKNYVQDNYDGIDIEMTQNDQDKLRW